MRILVTGGAGFIGSNFARLVTKERPEWETIVLDKLTYAGNPANVRDLRAMQGFSFVQGDICDKALVGDLIPGCDAVVNFAAETHVDRSLAGADDFVRTDILGTNTMLEVVRHHPRIRYLQVSTDEVYGSLPTGSAVEDSPLNPGNPYSASKAGGDLLALSYHRSFGLDVVITRSSNNFGPYQYPEKVMPLFLTNVLEGKPVPLYGDGMNVRDWLFVEDNCRGVLTVLEKGVSGEVYNIGAGNELPNIEVTMMILDAVGASSDMIRYVEDRPGHDRRYSLKCDKIARLGWAPSGDFPGQLSRTAAWYRDNRAWWEPLKSGEFKDYYRRMYEGRRGYSETSPVSG
ncbi:dTDP-glucose 4,6-dehydratase [Candidatus Fermentibacteria bacterium]|nr:dTDP-glucose 4,6-dehydratase [Candidatus Fermentibacteria bacterium]